jgi:transposase
MSKPKDVIKQIKKEARRQFSAEKKIRIVLEGLRGETPISEICRREGIASSVYYKVSKTFLEAGKNGLTRAVIRDATADEVKQLKQENTELKTSLAEVILQIQRYKKSLGM